MLREITFILIIMVLIFSGNFIVQNILKDSTETLVAKIDEIKENVEDIEKIKSTVNELDQEWERVCNIWSIIVSHQELDQIEIALLSAKIAFENEDLDDAEIELERLDFLLNHINEKEAFLLKNIF